ncbi:hypothetical protein AURDEDRAFT_139437 [Auricularia subglabra TFB-10046 SS5]|uniref:GST N-terminal domain-containing protein n=1 Tax=Auricularia subglabra (strain TFB-10046 / SS5) TaxID=717982 RepID=J0DBX5_AURST|nr:hypothetical protein AURDEDRAFT_139437 [Auricularia subglabra TFB-10046 SS5]
MTGITFYDLASNRGAMSPFTWRTRLALNYKGIAYKTHWLRFPEIEPYLKSIGAVPTEKNPLTGADLYTVPVVSFDGKLVVDSEAIAEHLERAFPDGPTLFPPGTRALQKAFATFFMAQVFFPTGPVIGPGVPAIVDAESAEYVRALRRAPDGAPLDEWAPLGSEKRANAWTVAEDAWGKLAAVYCKSDGPGVWLSGTAPIYADFVVLGALIFMAKVVTQEEWKVVTSWHDGLWGRLWQAGEPYMQAD